MHTFWFIQSRSSIPECLSVDILDGQKISIYEYLAYLESDALIVIRDQCSSNDYFDLDFFIYYI